MSPTCSDLRLPVGRHGVLLAPGRDSLGLVVNRRLNESGPAGLRLLEPTNSERPEPPFEEAWPGGGEAPAPSAADRASLPSTTAHPHPPRRREQRQESRWTWGPQSSRCWPEWPPEAPPRCL